MTDIGEERDVQSRDKKLRDAEAARATTLRLILSQRNGRDFIWWILDQGSPYASSMRFDQEGRADPIRMGHAEGWRGLASLIMAEVMRADPKAYILMLTENRNVAELEKMNERTTD